MRFPLPANRQFTARRRALALTEVDALAVNLLHDVRALDARLRRAGLGSGTIAYPELRLFKTGVECIQHELIEARAETPRGFQLPRWARVFFARLRPAA